MDRRRPPTPTGDPRPPFCAVPAACCKGRARIDGAQKRSLGAPVCTVAVAASHESIGAAGRSFRCADPRPPLCQYFSRVASRTSVCVRCTAEVCRRFPAVRAHVVSLRPNVARGMPPGEFPAHTSSDPFVEARIASLDRCLPRMRTYSPRRRARGARVQPSDRSGSAAKPSRIFARWRNFSVVPLPARHSVASATRPPAQEPQVISLPVEVSPWPN
jgi:hypothetical protein